MKKISLNSLALITLVAIVTFLIVTTAMASDIKTTQVPDEQQLLEWDGTTLNIRSVQVSSAVEQEFLNEYNRLNREQAGLWQQYQSGQLPGGDVIETEHGIVTVEKTVTESNPIVSTPTEISVEIERIETPYGIITIEKQSFGKPISEADEVAVLGVGDSGITRGLSEYSDALYQNCGSNGVEFNFGSNNTLSNYELHWSGGSYSNYVYCSSSSCSFEITTSWAAYYTYGKAYTTTPGYVYGFGFDDYRCH